MAYDKADIKRRMDGAIEVLQKNFPGFGQDGPRRVCWTLLWWRFTAARCL